MKNIIIILMIILGGIVPGQIVEVMAQQMDLPRESEPFPTILRMEGLLRRGEPTSPGAMVRQSRPYTPSQMVDFESNDGAWTVIRTLSFSTKSKSAKNSLFDNLITSISIGRDNPSVTAGKDKPSVATNKEKFSQVPSGVRIGYGLTYYLPISHRFSTYVQLKPPSLKSVLNFKNVFTAPHTMLAVGFQIPISTATSPAGHNVFLKFSGAVDQQNRPIISVIINLTPFKR